MIEPFPGKLTRSTQWGTPYVLTTEQEVWLRKYYPIEANATITKFLGIRLGTLKTLAKRHGITKDKEALSKILSENQKRLVESERRRERWGLPRKTTYHLPAKKYTKRELIRRWKAKKIWGYIPGDYVEERHVIFYDSQTKRNKKFETYCKKAGFEIKEIEQQNQDNDGNGDDLRPTDRQG